DRHDETVRATTAHYSGRLIKIDGDGALATFDGPARALRCAIDVGDQMKRLGVEIRSGLHTGEVEMRGDDVAGMAVHVASRIKDQAGPSELLASSTVKDLVIGSGLEFDEGKRVSLKGIPNEWTVHRVIGGR
ncbi:MAG: adenylate/guanylate cyclase domain-containing protein, partial [Actinomycetota bacterium]